MTGLKDDFDNAKGLLIRTLTMNQTIYAFPESS